VEKQQETLLYKGKLEISGEKLTCGELDIALGEIADLSMHGQRSVVFTSKGKYYELKAEKGTNMLKIMLFYNACKAAKAQHSAV
jgi:hypothetical protein